MKYAEERPTHGNGMPHPTYIPTPESPGQETVNPRKENKMHTADVQTLLRRMKKIYI
jgi:hypothetical protein